MFGSWFKGPINFMDSIPSSWSKVSILCFNSPGGLPATRSGVPLACTPKGGATQWHVPAAEDVPLRTPSGHKWYKAA